MKGLGDARVRHLSGTLDSHPDSLYIQQERTPYLISSTDSYPPEPRYTPENSLHPDCLYPLNNQLSNSSTFPRIHFNSHYEPPEDTPSYPTPHVPPAKINRLPASLLDQFEKQLPVHKDGFSTLQFQRGAPEGKDRSESPGRIRHLVNSVQKLFNKSQSLEGGGRASVNGKKGSSEDSKGTRRSKSKERGKGDGKGQTRGSGVSGWWSSDDNLDSDTGGYRNPAGMMTLGRRPEHAARHFISGYNTISESMLKASKSNNDLKFTPFQPPSLTLSPLPTPQEMLPASSTSTLKRGSWSTLTLSHAREVCQKASATIDKAFLKSKSCHQDLSYQYLQVPSGDWNGPPVKDDDIPCRRMRSGSYIKAMGDVDSDESEGSPQPSPKTAARRQSYLKATQLSLSEQSTTQRSLDRVDSMEILSPPKFQSWEEDYNQMTESVAEDSSVCQVLIPSTLRSQLHLVEANKGKLSPQLYKLQVADFAQLTSLAVHTLTGIYPYKMTVYTHMHMQIRIWFGRAEGLSQILLKKAESWPHPQPNPGFGASLVQRPDWCFSRVIRPQIFVCDHHKLLPYQGDFSSIAAQDSVPRCLIQYQIPEVEDQRDRYHLNQAIEEQRERYQLSQAVEEQRERYQLSQAVEEQRERYQLSQTVEEQRDRFQLCQVPEEQIERFTLCQVPEEQNRFQLCQVVEEQIERYSPEDPRERFPLNQVPEEKRERYPLCTVPEEQRERYPMCQAEEEQSDRFPMVPSVFEDSGPVKNEAFDLNLPNYFRSRSHSYLRAIQAGCSEDDDTTSLQSMSPPLPVTSRTLPRHIGECEHSQCLEN
ncbi:hypothetical protein XELAEV_18003096mg [Xenopus laevis]|nr:hypothetical protein XELAEV_18003096mg [Xenopus laevis]